jgi:hypothetical protein
LEKGNEDCSKKVTKTRARKVKKVRCALIRNPCAAWKPPLLTEDLHTFLGSPQLDSIEEKKKSSATYFKEIEDARRSYPQISGYYSID